MKAILVRDFGGPEVLVPADVPDPEPQPGQVLVKLQAAGVNPVETYIRSGTYYRTPPLPWIPGFDGAGIVEAVGEGVSGFNTGDCVYVATLGAWTGTYAERVACDARHVHPLPSLVSFAQGAAIGVPVVTAYRALFDRAHARPGETVLVRGASGAVGSAAVQLARSTGLTVFGTAGSDEGLALAQSLGASHVFDHRDADHAAQIKEATGARGVDIILEVLANAHLDADLDLLALRGRVVIVGSRGRVEIDPRRTMGKDSAIMGMALWNMSEEDSARIHSRIVEALQNGTLSPVVGREFPLEQAAAAQQALFEGSTRGKIVLTV